ncbi:g4305 [Coccomyxa viridis]|uniref:G4305 protein n=1 Tax=Coccomyxa viridis TaxID=1274662 RepID=A0ABP1FTZ7_9CHLO
MAQAGRLIRRPCDIARERNGWVAITRPPSIRRRVRAHADYRWSASSSGRRIRDTLLDNVDTSSASRDDSQAQDAGEGRADDRKNGMRVKQDADLSERPEQLDEDDEPPGKASAVQAGAAWDKARVNGQEDNGWGPGIPNLEREDWDWGAAAGRTSNRASSNGSSPGGWSTKRDRPAAESTWNEPELNQAEESAADPGAWDDDLAGNPGSGELPDIVELRPEEAAAILPVAPTAEQIQFCSGDTSTLWQRLGISALLTLATLKTAALAAGSLTFPLWYPSLRAALRNRSIKGKYRCIGLWRVAVMEVDVVAEYEPRFQQPYQRATAGRGQRLLRLLVGDASGARSQLSVPYQKRYDAIRTGEPAEVLVLSKSREFESFKALKEVYLPECGVWVSDYPFLKREAYLECSLEIERERQQELAQGGR